MNVNQSEAVFTLETAKFVQTENSSGCKNGTGRVFGWETCLEFVTHKKKNLFADFAVLVLPE